MYWQLPLIPPTDLSVELTFSSLPYANASTTHCYQYSLLTHPLTRPTPDTPPPSSRKRELTCIGHLTDRQGATNCAYIISFNLPDNRLGR